MDKKHKDTTISLHPLSFEDAIKELATPNKSKAKIEEPGNTKTDAPQSESST